LQKRLLRRFNALAFTTYSFWVGSLLLPPFGEGFLTALRTATPNATWALVFLGIFPAPTSRGRRPWPASGFAHQQFFYLMPVATVVIAWLWLAEIPTAREWVGGALALTGVLLVNVWGHGVPADLTATPKPV
jgi:drug/metabolite transporter (DMT)-like permease